MAGVVASLVLAAPAWAHDGPDGASDPGHESEHARADLAGESMTRIERDTAAQARRLGKRHAVRRTTAATGADVPTDPALSGRWSPVVDTPVVPVFQAVLPSGKVLMWDSVGDTGAEGGSGEQTYTRAMVWDPTTNTATRVDVQDANIFCAGYTQLPDGDVLVVGGNKNTANVGLRDTHIFHWRSQTWTRGPDMPAERWYPSVAALANGEAVIVGGGPSQAEVFQADGTLRPLTGFVGYAYRLYPFLVQRGDGRVEVVGPDTTFDTMDTSGAGSMDAHTTSIPADTIRDYGSFATYLPDHTLVAGGGRTTEDGESTALRSTELVDTSGSTTTVTAGAPMAFTRRQFDLTILDDGSVLATGGMRTGAQTLIDPANPVLAAERWDPATDTWTTLASAARVRQYHSSAALLPDGRVLTGGGGVCGECVAAGYLEKNIEYYSPPYLFDPQGGGTPARRPALVGVPGTVSVGQDFTFRWSGGSKRLGKVGLIRLGAPTHGVDQGQRYVPLSFTAADRTKVVTAAGPSSAADAPPGYYLLVVEDDRGVPSVARIVQVLPGPNLALAGTPTALTTASPAQGARAASDTLLGTRWGSKAATGQWWQTDLGRTTSLGSVVVEWDARAPRTFAVQVATASGGPWTTVATGSAAASTTSRVPLDGVRGRYVRVLDTTAAPAGAAGMSLAEVQVFGAGS